MTEDWPELTTYFDAEIIGGSRYGFLTSDKEYGASEAEDMTHWGRFPAFRSIKPELKRPGLTISDRELARRGVVFMRWKERFLVPDWKVRDINGASFAGTSGEQLVLQFETDYHQRVLLRLRGVWTKCSPLQHNVHSTNTSNDPGSAI